LTEVPFEFLVQLSDPHVGATWGFGDPAARFEAAVEAVLALPDRPDALLLTGDLADHAADKEYELVRVTVASLGLPVYVLPGNHDDRAALRRHFDVPGEGDEPVHYAVDLGPLRLIALDTKRDGRDDGALGEDQLEWLDVELAATQDRPVLLAMHHPPFALGIPVWDDLGLVHGDRLALAEIVRRHPHVRRIVAGHVHRAIAADVAGRLALSVPSTYVQARLHFGATELELVDEPAGFAVHAIKDGELTSYILPV
jgi:3',5'-cyclic AMP phosphodiesterase CpdA